MKSFIAPGASRLDTFPAPRPRRPMQNTDRPSGAQRGPSAADMEPKSVGIRSSSPDFKSSTESKAGPSGRDSVPS